MNYQNPIPKIVNEQSSQTVESLTKQVDKLTIQVAELAQRISFLERENNRRKAEITAHKKG